MSSTIDFAGDLDLFPQSLRAYIAKVARALGIGLESCAFDLDVPVSAYLALDTRLDRFPDRDLALLWDEVHGWAAAIEASCGEDVIVLNYAGEEILPAPGAVARFVRAVRDGDHSIGRPNPPTLRRAGRHEELLAHLVTAN